MEEKYKMRFIARPAQGHEERFIEAAEVAGELSAGDTTQSLFNGGSRITVADGQWIIADEKHISFAVTCQNLEILIDAVSLFANRRADIKAVWASSVSHLTKYVPSCFDHYEKDGVYLTCASMGRVSYNGTAYGLYHAPESGNKERIYSYYNLVWGKADPHGGDIETFFADETALQDEPTYPNYKCVDEYGNWMDVSYEAEVCGHSSRGDREVYALPVRKMLCEGGTKMDFSDGRIFTFPSVFMPLYQKNKSGSPVDYLRAYHLAKGDYENDVGGYLLDKDGNRIKSLADFDHALDDDGEGYYPVPESDMDGTMLSRKAEALWRKKLNLPENVTEGGVSFNAGKTELIELLDKTAESVTVSDGVLKIRAHAFKNCTALKEVFLPASLTEIGLQAFSGCTSLKSIAIPDGVAVLASDFSESNISGGGGIFGGCTALESVTLGSGLTEIGEDTFSLCTSLKTITIPRGVTYLYTNAFKKCSALSEIIVEEGNAVYRSADGLLYSADGTKLIFCPEGKCGRVEILKTATTFESRAFSGNPHITEVVLPPNLSELSSGERIFGLFEFCGSTRLVYSNPNGWFGTDDYNVLRKLKGGEYIRPENLPEAHKRYEFLYHEGFSLV